MTCKSKFNPKLKTYSALAASILGIGNMSEASIVYHDVSPDVTRTQTGFGSSSYAIDMDNSGSTDFNLKVAKVAGTSKGIAYTGTFVAILPSGSNNVDYKVNSLTKTSYAVALNANDNINNTLTWYTASASGAGLYLTGVVHVGGKDLSTGQFHNVTDKYLGVRFTNGANTYYGWIRVDVGDYNTFTVKDWAYENTPNKSIKAGQTVATGIDTYLSSTTTIKNVNNIIEAEFESAVQGKVNIVNISGSIVIAAEINGNSFSINMEGMPSGIYNVVVSVKEGAMAKKVFVE